MVTDTTLDPETVDPETVGPETVGPETMCIGVAVSMSAPLKSSMAKA